MRNLKVVGKIHDRVLRSSSRPSATARGVGYESGNDFGFPSFTPQPQEPVFCTPPPKVESPKQISPEDDPIQEAYFKLIAVLLSHQHSGTSNIPPAGHLALIISRSPLLERAATMLRINSVDAASTQRFIYEGMLDFVVALSGNAATTPLVHDDRPLYHERGGSLLDISFESKKSITASKVAMRDTGSALATLLSAFTEQANLVLTHACPHADEFSDTNGQNILALSRRLHDVKDLVNKNKHIFHYKMDTSGGSGPTRLSLSDWHRETSVRDLPDEVILDDFGFLALARQAVNQEPPRGRMKRLITEVSSLSTSLPEGIYVRHGSSRLDVMKILIIGTKGTPYEYGFFEFDLFCPINYPVSPPRVRFMTTNGGTVRFNPNLYEDGKVCLSLLGTWSGEPWRPGQSTILQVLVSIQSMILCEEPWYNEPGREHHIEPSMARNYNNALRAWTLNYAILPWASSVKARDNAVQAQHDAAEAAEKARKEREREREREKEREREQEHEEDVDTPPQPALPPLNELILVTRCWRQTAKVHLLIHAAELVKATEGSVELLEESDRSGLRSALDKIREVLKAQGFIV
ncbi:hypothetical protein SLS62_007787 [Diatrype stigma]|uniref:Ubiquitin-conjugating enzyme E2 Z n=1 Tax=Diatrype stigma TaxID=117547 RepID=A0AAN9ULE4_9PEZI